jgi:hypothetical protein
MSGTSGCPSIESFKILRGAPLCSANPANAWFAVIPTEPGNTRDPQNYINWKITNSTNSAVIKEPLPALPSSEDISGTIGATPFIVDSTRIIIQNLVNNNFIDILQEDAYCIFVSNSACPSLTGPDASTVNNPCVQPSPVTCVADGVLQFLALVQIAPSCTWLGTGLVITISPLSQVAQYQKCTYGNWCPFSFSIGNCNTQSATASLLYLTCANPSGYGYVYGANYANVRFTLLNKQKTAQGGIKKACYLGVDSLDKSSFLVFFAQERLIGMARILLISPIVDLKAIIWQPVFIITINTPLSLTCGTVA